MKLPSLASALIALALLSPASSALASTATYSLPGTSLVHIYDPGFADEFGSQPASARDYLASSLYPPVALPPLTANFSTDKTFEITLSVPEGFEFLYTPVPGASNSFSFALSYALPMGGITTSATFEWLGASGSAPTVTGQAHWMVDGGPAFQIGFFVGDLTEAFSFTGFKATVSVPEEFDAIYESTPMDSGSVEFSAELPSVGFPDPSFMVLPQPVPEPGVFALLAAGAAMLIARRRS